MLSRILFLLTLTLGSTLLFTWAWTGSFTSAVQKPDADFVPQTVPLDADMIGSGIDARQLLQKALERLEPKRTAWLKTKIRQTMTDAESSFVAHGLLQRGPDHCARLEMDIDKAAHLLVVCDGVVVAQVRKTSGADAQVEVTRLPSQSEEPGAEVAAKEQFLNTKSCGGPLLLLKEIQQQLHNAKLQTGMLNGAPMIQICGDLKQDATSTRRGTKLPALYAHVYLDATTLWPCRIEWWGSASTKASRPILRIEFLEPEVNRELSVEECTRMFSYRPDES